jgi:hypothetical protein
MLNPPNLEWHDKMALMGERREVREGQASPLRPLPPSLEKIKIEEIRKSAKY